MTAPILYHVTKRELTSDLDVEFWAALHGDGDSRAVHSAASANGQLWERIGEHHA